MARLFRYPVSESGEAIINDVAFDDKAFAQDHHRVFYEIFVGSFSDSDGDGIGDLRGIINRMDYLNDHDANVAFWQRYLDDLRQVKPDLYTVAEVWDSEAITDRYLPALNCFNFATSQTNGLLAETAHAGSVSRYAAYLEHTLDRIRAIRSDAMNIPFISNHDTDRAAGYLTSASGALQMAANLYLLTPGSPFIYYGEEIGLRGSRGGASTDANRHLAMVWGDLYPLQKTADASQSLSRNRLRHADCPQFHAVKGRRICLYLGGPVRGRAA